MTTRNKTREFIAALKSLKGNTCWGVIAGEGTGSAIAMDVGGKLQRAKPVTNPHLTEAQRQNVGEYGFYITCSWRLNSKSKVICSSKSSNHKDGPMEKGLSLLVDKRITKVKVTEPAFDTELEFDGSFRLTLFCDEANEADQLDNYSFFAPDVVYTVNAYGRKVVAEHRRIV